MGAIISILTYFTLNFLVTVSNKSIVSQTSSPYLLTTSHAVASFLSTRILQYNAHQPKYNHRTTHKALPHHHRWTLVLFSFLYTINIAMSNLTLNLVDLSVHQLVRATAPALTVIFSALLCHRPLSSYGVATYLSLVAIMVGVIVAVIASGMGNGSLHNRPITMSEVTMTFLGGILAVLKTILTHHLQTKTGLRGIGLIHFLSPWAFVQSLTFAYWAGEISIPNFTIKRNFTLSQAHQSQPASNPLGATTLDTSLSLRSQSLHRTIAANALLAAALNLSSFDANRRCGAVSMAVAANLKMVGILALLQAASGGSFRASTGTLTDAVTPALVVWGGTALTVVGGVAFALAQTQDNDEERQRMKAAQIKTKIKMKVRKRKRGAANGRKFKPSNV